MVICLERGEALHLAQLIPLTLTVSCFSKTQIGFTFLAPAHIGSPGQRAIKCACVRACVCATLSQVTWKLWEATEIYRELSVILVSGAS